MWCWNNAQGRWQIDPLLPSSAHVCKGTLGLRWLGETLEMWEVHSFPKNRAGKGGEESPALLAGPCRVPCPGPCFSGSPVARLSRTRRRHPFGPENQVRCSWTPDNVLSASVPLRCIHQGWWFIFSSSSTQFGEVLHVFVQSNPFLSSPILISPDLCIIFPLHPLLFWAHPPTPLKRKNIYIFSEARRWNTPSSRCRSLWKHLCSTLPRGYIRRIRWMRCSSALY